MSDPQVTEDAPPDPDDIDSVYKTAPAEQPSPAAPEQSPATADTAKKQSFSEFMNTTAPPQQKFSEFVKEPSLPANLFPNPLAEIKALATGDGMTATQRAIIAGQQTGRIGNAIGQNYDDYMTANFDDDKHLRSMLSAADSKNYDAGNHSINNAWWDGLVVPSLKQLNMKMQLEVQAAALYAYHTPGAIYAGIFGAGDKPAGVEQAAIESGFPGLGRTLSELPMAMIGEGLPVKPEEAIRAVETRNLNEPVTSAVIGPDASESAYFGTTKPSPKLQAAIDKAAAALPPEPPIPDIHQMAREIAPETFAPYDQLTHEHAMYSGMLRTLQEGHKADETLIDRAPHTGEIAELQAKLDNPSPNASQRVLKGYQDKIDDLTDRNEEWLAGQRKIETPEMSKLRDLIVETDKKLRDIANTGKIAAAYREAESRLPTEAPPLPVAEEPAAPKAPPAAAPAAGTQAPVPRPVEEQKQFIVADVSGKLQAAGRPAAEANAAAQLVAEHYQAVADQGWAKGTAQEIYERHAAEIQAGKSRAQPAKVLAQAESRTLAQKAKGKIRIAMNDAKNTITLFKTADASTFIHETGHHWLEEMMRFSEEEGAPESLRGHAEAVRKWLGNDGGDLTGRQHEKFARGFERYMMEGVAPSKSLIDVFAQFKQWLTTIYQTVSRLKAPITDDIRNVFDHLLSATPERTVVAPDIEPASTMAKIHETDALRTEPERSSEVRDNIEKEVDLTARQTKPEVEDAVRTASETGEVGGEAQGDSAPAETSAIPGAGGPVAAEQPGEIPKGGGVSGAEGGGVRTGAGDGRGAAGSAEQRGPEARDRYIGNINANRSNIIASDSLEQSIREAAAKNDEFMAQRRGRMTAGQIIDLADRLGMDPSFLDGRKIGQAFNAEEIVCINNLLTKAHESMEAARVDFLQAAEEGKAEAARKYAQEISWFEYIQGKASQASAEAGRAQFAHSMLVKTGPEIGDIGEFLKKNTGRDLFQLEQIAQFSENLTQEQKAKFIRDTANGRLQHAVLYYYINSLLSGPFTHMRYFIGNELKTLVYRPLIETPVAAAIGALREAATGVKDLDRVEFREIGEQLSGWWLGHKDGYYASVKAFKSGMSDPLPGEQVFSNPVVSNVPMLGKGEGLINRAIETYGLPTRSVAAIHSMNKTVAYTQAIYAQAARMAIREGLDGEALADRIAFLKQNPTEEMMHTASDTALQQMYMGATEYSSMMGNLTRAVNSNIFAKILIPFLKVGSQITKEAFVQGSPLGLFTKEVQENIAAGGARRDMQIARISAGTGLMATGVMLTRSGQMTGDGPNDPKARAEWLLTHKANSINIGSISIPYSGLGSMGMALRFAANMAETSEKIGHDDMAKVAYSFIEGISKSVLDDNFMRGAKDFLDAVYHPEEFGAQYIKSMVTNWIPWSVGLGQTARVIDPDMREAHTLMEEARKKIPFESEGLFPKRDRFGEVIPQAGSQARYKNDPVVARLDALGVGISKPEAKIRGVKLDESQSDQYAMIAGRLTKMRLNNIVAQSGFSQLSAAAQIDKIKKIVDSSREQARRVMMSNYPEIARQAHANKTRR